MSEWTSVAKKKSTGKSSIAHSVHSAKLLAKGHAALSSTTTPENPQKIVDLIRDNKLSVQNSGYFHFIRDSILSYNVKFDHMVALGLGSLTSETSKLQLVLFLCLCESLPSIENARHVSIFDPCLSELDRDVYSSLNVPVLTENSKGKHRIAEQGNTLFFLPHCPYRLYCNILWANWDHFDKLYLLGNRLVM